MVSLALGISPASLGILFAVIFISSLGVPGATFWMLSAGALASSASDLVAVMIVVAMAAILGDLTAYELARRFSLPVSKLLRRFRIYRKNEQKVRSRLARSEFSLVFFTRFLLTALCSIVSYVSGFMRLSRARFAAAVVAGESLYGILYPALGFMFKETWRDLSSVLQDAILIVALVVIAILLVRIAIGVMRNSR
jgi:membrane protein DedA with SNARE-associated domain